MSKSRDRVVAHSKHVGVHVIMQARTLHIDALRGKPLFRFSGAFEAFGAGYRQRQPTGTMMAPYGAVWLQRIKHSDSSCEHARRLSCLPRLLLAWAASQRPARRGLAPRGRRSACGNRRADSRARTPRQLHHVASLMFGPAASHVHQHISTVLSRPASLTASSAVAGGMISSLRRCARSLFAPHL